MQVANQVLLALLITPGHIPTEMDEPPRIDTGARRMAIDQRRQDGQHVILTADIEHHAWGFCHDSWQALRAHLQRQALFECGQHVRHQGHRLMRGEVTTFREFGRLAGRQPGFSQDTQGIPTAGNPVRKDFRNARMRLDKEAKTFSPLLQARA
jgi:hypothetical protein